MSSLPPELAPWAPLLQALAEPLALEVGRLARRLDAAMGPLRPRIPRSGGEPDGYRGLSRRGPYDRLLLSEWALLDEAPDEFIRRAAEREHAFLQLDHRSPQQGVRCEAVFDAGPESLGSPRIVHVAMLIVLARRAQAADAEFSWRVAQRPERSFSGVDSGTIRYLLDSRTGAPFVAPKPEGPTVDERWFVGGVGVRGEAGVICAVVSDVIDSGANEVSVSIERPGRMPATLDLELPPADRRAQLVTDPTVRERAKIVDRAGDGGKWRTLPEHVSGPRHVRFMYGTEQFAAAFGSGQVLVWSLAKVPNCRVPKAKIEEGLPPAGLIAFGYSHQATTSVVLQGDHGVGVFGRGISGRVPNAPRPVAGIGELISLPWDGSGGQKHLFTDGKGLLWTLHRGRKADGSAGDRTDYALTGGNERVAGLATTNQGGWLIVENATGDARFSVRLVRANGAAVPDLPLPRATQAQFVHGFVNDHQYVGILTVEEGKVVGRGLHIRWQSGPPTYVLEFIPRGELALSAGVFVGGSTCCRTPDGRVATAAVSYEQRTMTFRRDPDGARFSVPRNPEGARVSFDGEFVGFWTNERTVELWSFTTGAPVMLRAENV